MSFVISVIIIIGAIAAVVVENYKKRYYFSNVQCLFAVFSIISAIVVSIILIILQINSVRIEEWVICVLFFVSGGICALFYLIFHKYEEKFETIYPLISIIANMAILYFGSMIVAS